MTTTSQCDLFGVEIVDSGPVLHPTKKKRSYKPEGYARRPESGPPGETCKSCVLVRRMSQGNKTFYKCTAMRHAWTHSVKTDVLASSPACEMWQPKPEIAAGGGA